MSESAVIETFDKFRIIENFDKGLARGKRHDKPFLLYEFSPWSPEIYAMILKYMPNPASYFPLDHKEAKRPDGTYARMRWPLQKHRIASLPGEQRDFWAEMYVVLRSDELRDVFKRWLEPTLVARFKCPLAEIPAFPAPQLLRDTFGYKISPHADTDAKTITTQWYLPSTTYQSHLGTRIHEKLPTGELPQVGQVPFLPNTGYAFGVNPDSWHSVAPMTPEDGVRDSLMMFYYTKDITPP